jgi:hypothetical protein
LKFHRELKLLSSFKSFIGKTISKLYNIPSRTPFGKSKIPKEYYLEFFSNLCKPIAKECLQNEFVK